MSEEGLRRMRLLTTAVAVLLAVSGAAAVAVGIGKQDPAPPAPPAESSRPLTDGSSAGSSAPAPAAPPAADRSHPRPAVAELDYSPPVHIAIPRIGVSSPLLELGLDAGGAMETPQPPYVDQAGWFRPSPPPGIPGATVIAGHVTWNQEPEVFFRLGDLHKGDRVKVRREDGITTTFEVYRVGSFPKDGFPTQAVYNQPDRSELRLITCGGEYDAVDHRYLSNVIAWARIVRVSR